MWETQPFCSILPFQSKQNRENPWKRSNKHKGNKSIRPLADSESEGEYLYPVKTTEKRRPYTRVKVLGHSFNAMVDTGASIYVIDKETFAKLPEIELEKTKTRAFAYVKDLIFAIRNIEEPIAHTTSEPWCKCGSCIPMQNEEERKCCGRRICVTSYYMFKKICLDRDVLRMQILARSDMRAEPIEFNTNLYRKAAYQQYALWKYENWVWGTGEFYLPAFSQS